MNFLPEITKNKTVRILLAIELPDSIKDILAAQQKDLKQIRWVSRNNMHITLRFIGEVPQKQLPVIKSSLADFQGYGFNLRINRLGFFYRKPQAVVWAGLEKSEGLNKLKEQSDTALSQAGLEFYDNRFSPHITLGRMKEADVQELKTFVSNSAVTTEFWVESFALVSSILLPEGPKYTAEKRYRLL